MTNEYRYLLEQNFIGVNRLFVLVYTNQDANAKTFNARKDDLPKAIIKNYDISSMKKFFMMNQLIQI